MEEMIAHEIGHVFIGSGHAESAPVGTTQTYACYLPNSDPQVRLMVGGDNWTPSKSACLLIKCEWDKIHQSIAAGF
jgi:hypothetical protein